MSARVLTVGELKALLQGLADDTVVSIAGGLSVYRFKRISDNEVFLEFGEPEAHLSAEFKRLNPHVQVAFINPDADDGSIYVGD